MNNLRNRTLNWTYMAGVVVIGVGLSACSPMETRTSAAAPSGDGDVPVPGDYRNWSKFVPTIDKPNGQIREIYINGQGLRAERGDAFPDGTVSVMEIYMPRKSANGDPVKDSQGRLIKDKLDKIFVMAKGKAWGQTLPAGTIDNGDWLYAAYQGDAKTPATNDFSGCRTCHAPLADSDYIARYDEHFDQR